ncbi:methylmalonyl-CoA mutase family protein [Belliella sp. DSM 111904]|uniref:Methylmalonyl-CoA mutase family protein n=1 Tax=Belliella filtrata TaxID=2923435 RepID=A0ABS9UY57_9BACT|nr:methylmalonyl-CoA mutase family protein [Belliella filtrata]MCH7409098.1 methylmalonyl-CoA mutase family protein [Belliella filtrata]
MRDKLFEDFRATSKSDWMEQVLKDLKGKSFEDTLISQAEGGIHIKPFYTREDLGAEFPLSTIHNQVNPIPSLPGLSPRQWSNTVRVAVGEQNEVSENKKLINALQTGADGLVLSLTGKEDLAVLLKDVEPSYIQIFIEPKDHVLNVAEVFEAWLESKNVDLNDVIGGFLWDPATVSLTLEFYRSEGLEVIKKLLVQFEKYPNFKTFTIDFAHYHHAGGLSFQELSYGFGAFLEHVDRLTEEGVSLELIFKNVLLKSAVGSDFFLEIVKLKVARMLIFQIANLFKHKLDPKSIPFYVQTSYWSKSKFDMDTNMLRNTTEAMSAIIGGCTALEVLPHDLSMGSSRDFASRMARNVSSILKEEAYLDKVLDPAAGSYYIEKLAEELFNRVINGILTVDAEGGWWSMSSLHDIQAEIKETRSQRQDELISGQSVKVGVNKYKQEKANASIDDESEMFDYQLNWSRHALKYELLNSSNS